MKIAVRKHRLRLSIRIVSFASLLPLLFSRPAQAANWLESWPEALQQMQSQNKPGVLYFYNVTTRDCKRMDDETLAAPLVDLALRDFVAIRLDPSRNLELAKHYDVFKVPSVIFIAPNGNMLDQAIGYKSPDLFHAYLTRAFGYFLQEAGQNTGKAQTSTNQSATSENAASSTDNIFKLTRQRPFTIPVQFTTAANWAAPPALIGDFNDWQTDQVIPLQQSGPQKWQVTLYLPQGIYEYKYYVNGEYIQDSANKNMKPNPYGGYNSIAIVGNPVNINPNIRPNAQQPGYYDVTWGYYSEIAEKIEIGGNFSNWSPIVMFKNPNYRGEWGIRYTLPPGEYEYKLIIDGEWANDPYNYLYEENSGNRNNYFKIP